MKIIFVNLHFVLRKIINNFWWHVEAWNCIIPRNNIQSLRFPIKHPVLKENAFLSSSKHKKKDYLLVQYWNNVSLCLDVINIDTAKYIRWLMALNNAYSWSSMFVEKRICLFCIKQDKLCRKTCLSDDKSRVCLFNVFLLRYTTINYH